MLTLDEEDYELLTGSNLSEVSFERLAQSSFKKTLSDAKRYASDPIYRESHKTRCKLYARANYDSEKAAKRYQLRKLTDPSLSKQAVAARKRAYRAKKANELKLLQGEKSSEKPRESAS